MRQYLYRPDARAVRLRCSKHQETAARYAEPIPLVDNANFGYHLQCQLSEVSFYGEALGIFGAVVTYKITAANG